MRFSAVLEGLAEVNRDDGRQAADELLSLLGEQLRDITAVSAHAFSGRQHAARVVGPGAQGAWWGVLAERLGVGGDAVRFEGFEMDPEKRDTGPPGGTRPRHRL